MIQKSLNKMSEFNHKPFSKRTTTMALEKPAAIAAEEQQQSIQATSGFFFGNFGGQTSLLGLAAPGTEINAVDPTKTALKKLLIAGALSLIPTLAIFAPFLLAALKRRRSRRERQQELLEEMNRFRRKRLLFMNNQRQISRRPYRKLYF